MNLLQALRARPAEQRFSFSDYLGWFSHNGLAYPLGFQQTWTSEKSEQIEHSFDAYVHHGLKANPVIFGLEMVRFLLFSEATFKWQRLSTGDLFGDPSLSPLEKPWPGGTTGDLLTIMLLDADFAGNAYVTRDGSELVRLRPDWTKIVLEDRVVRGKTLGMRRAGYVYQEGGPHSQNEPIALLPEEVAHFAPLRDPQANYRGMSWLTPAVREIEADSAATRHKLKFFENAATPNLAVSLKEGLTPEQFQAFVDKMDATHKGVDNAYRTLYTANGADVTVIGKDLKELDFGSTQGKGETRLAVAAGVPAVIAGLSEGLAGSSLNAGNYQMARRRLADGTMWPLWRNVSGSLAPLLRAPDGARLWVDVGSVAFLREDQKDAAEIVSVQSQAVRTLTDSGYTPESAVQAVHAGDLRLLRHTGLFSVQLQPPGAQAPSGDPA